MKAIVLGVCGLSLLSTACPPGEPKGDASSAKAESSAKPQKSSRPTTASSAASAAPTAAASAPPAASASAAAAPADGGEDFEAFLTGEPPAAANLKPGILTGVNWEYKLQAPEGWKSNMINGGEYLAFSADQSAVYMTRGIGGAKGSCDMVGKRSTAAPMKGKNVAPAGEPKVVAVGKNKFPALAGRCTAELDGEPGEIIWFDMDADSDHVLVMMSLKKSASPQVRDEARGLLRSMSHSKGKPGYKLP